MTAARRLSPADQLAHTAEQRKLRLTLAEALPPPSAPGPRTPTAAERLARQQQLQAAGLDEWTAEHLVQAEVEAGTLLRTGREMALPAFSAGNCWGPLEVEAPRAREPGAHYGPVADLPAAPARWSWADVVALPPAPPARAPGIPDPLDRRSR